VLFEHQFEGLPTLIYGTNGSGKSSLLSAVGWILTDTLTNDGDEVIGEIPIYRRKDASADPTKVCSWPGVHTLPYDRDPTTVPTNCWAEIHLIDSASTGLFLRRDLKGLSESADGDNWAPCASLAAHGISPLDLQLSLSAAAMFSHKSLGGAKGAQHLLTMILGFEDLEDLGKLASNLTGNLSRTATEERRQAEAATTAARARLSALVPMLRDDHPLHASVGRLAGGGAISPETVLFVAEEAAVAVAQATAQLANIIGLDVTDGAAPAGLADGLVAAIKSLESPWRDRFRNTAALRPDRFLPGGETETLDDRLGALEGRLDDFLAGAVRRTEERLAWWREEQAPASRKTLLIQAATHFHDSDSLCPVCRRSVEGLPIAAELLGLAGASEDLRNAPAVFFQGLKDELLSIVSESALAYGSKDPAALVRADWAAFSGGLSRSLGALVDRWATAVGGVVDALPAVVVLDGIELPHDADQRFAHAAEGFLGVVRRARRTIGVMRWALGHLDGVEARLEAILTRAADGAVPSLLATLCLGRAAADDVRPVTLIRAELLAIHKEREAAAQLDCGLEVIEGMKLALEELKPIGAYAIAEVKRVFGDIEARTIEKFEKLYFSPNESLRPSRIRIGKGRDRSVEALLSAGAFEVSGQHVSNAGQLRALALAFYFAVLDKHPRGLGFVVMDDPILSLDEDNRREWSNGLLQPALEATQFIVSTHQRHYLDTCRTDFHAGRVLEINHRRNGSAMTIRDGGRLGRAADLLETIWTGAANEMRKYREDVLITLDSYSPVAVFTTANLANSQTAYADLTAPHVLVHKNRDKILGFLRGRDVASVLDAGSHAHTEADVGLHDARTCLDALQQLDKVFRREVARLNEHQRRPRRAAAVEVAGPTEADDRPIAPVIPLRFPLPRGVAAEPDPMALRFSVIGSAAAQTHGHVVDYSDRPSSADFHSGHAIVVMTDALLPIAQPGQWALLAAESEPISDGDLVAAFEGPDRYYLRRAWSSGEQWLLGAVNPLAKQAVVMISRSRCALRKILGIVSHPLQSQPQRANDSSREWTPHGEFSERMVAGGQGVRIVGKSLEPMAKDGQFVLVGAREESYDRIPAGGLFVVETRVPSIGNVIKLAFASGDNIALASPNPVDPHEPIFVAKRDVKAMRPVRGVLFDARLADDGVD
jgi:energy-coupling factor transporter ATP-binding protein EcfA2